MIGIWSSLIRNDDNLITSGSWLLSHSRCLPLPHHNPLQVTSHSKYKKIQIQKDKNTNTNTQNPHHSDQWSEVLFLRCCNLHVFSSFDVDDDTNDDHHIGHIYHLMTTVMLMLMIKLNNKHHCMGFAHFLHKFFNRNLDLRL